MLKRKSTVWNFFVRKNKDEAKCTKCEKIMKSSGGSTTSLILHLKKIHQIDVKEGSDQPLAKMARTMVDFLQKKSMEEEISRLAAIDGFSFNSIAKSNFIQTNLHDQSAKYNRLPPTSANGVKNIVMDYYRTEKEKLANYFKNEVSRGIRYSLTLDEYTSIQNKRYMNINVHTKDRHWSLGLIEIKGSLNSTRTEEFVRGHLHQFELNLDDHIVACTTDGAAVMVKFGKEIKANHQQCIAHCIHLSVIDILYGENVKTIVPIDETSEDSESDDDDDDDDDEMSRNIIPQTDLAHENACFPQPKTEFNDVIKKVRRICKLFRKSPMKNEILQDFVRANFDGIEYKLLLDCKTRWNSTFHMIERFLKLKICIPNALRAVLSTEAVSDDEWKILDMLYKTLHPVQLILNAICTDDTDLLKAEYSIQFLLEKLDIVNNTLALKLRERLFDRYSKRRNIETLTLLSYLNNPKKFKGSITGPFPFLTKQNLRKFTEQEYRRLFPEHHKAVTTETCEENETEEDINTNVPVVASTSKTTDDDLMREYNSALKKMSEEAKNDTNELDISKEMRYFEVTSNRSENLEKMYKSFLTIKATSVQSERAFSITGLFNTKIRTRLSGKTLDALCFLKDHFQKKVQI